MKIQFFDEKKKREQKYRKSFSEIPTMKKKIQITMGQN